MLDLHPPELVDPVVQQQSLRAAVLEVSITFCKSACIRTAGNYGRPPSLRPQIAGPIRPVPTCKEAALSLLHWSGTLCPTLALHQKHMQSLQGQLQLPPG